MKQTTFDPGPANNNGKASTPYYHSVKQSLDNILKHQESKDIILQSVLSAHKITIHTYQFLKLYLLYHYDINEPLSRIDKELILMIMKVICKKKGKKEKVNSNEPKVDKRRTQASIVLQEKLTLFHNIFYKPTMMDEQLDRTNLINVLSYLALDIATTYETNIKQHYAEYVERFINVLFQKKQTIKTLSKSEESAFLAKLRAFKNSVFDHSSNIDPLLNPHLPSIIPQRPFNKNLKYDLQCSPQDYLPCMLYMMKFVESQNETTYNLFPLRTELIPKYIRLDTTSLVYLLMTKDNKHKYGNKEDFKNGNTSKRADEIWSFFFRTEKRCFSKPDGNTNRHTFAHMIETDGVACSILWVRKDVASKKKKPKLKSSSEKYIDDEDIDLSSLQGKKIVGIDPGKCDLIFCVADSGDGHSQKFRYTQDQRRKETKQKKYRDIRDMFKTKTDIEGKNAQEWEAELSAFNRKTLDMYKFHQYVIKKNEINRKLITFYEQNIFRKLKWNSFMNKQRSEAKMINRFKKTFGNPKDVVIGIGDWEQKKQMKYKEPTKGKGFRKLFRKAGYKVYLVDEYRTSCRCYDCEGECEKFLECKNPRPWKATQKILRHGLVMCKTCKRTWNRDMNGSLNMHWIMKKTIEGEGRPEYLRRGGEKRKGKGRGRK